MGRLAIAAQRGYTSLAFGMIGLVMCGAVAAPLVARAATALRAQETSSPIKGGLNGAISAAEHALWRIAHDAAFVEGMTGEPPSAVYTLNLPEGTATITVTQSSEAPEGDGLSAQLTVTPWLIPPDTATTVAYTLRVVNDGTVARSIDRAEADPKSFSPAYQTGSTTGFTTSDPTYESGKWRWSIVPAVSVAPLGGEVSMSWQMEIDEGEGDYFVEGSARIIDVGTVKAPLTSSVRVASMSDIEIFTVVDPPLVSAGDGLEFEFVVTVTNNATSTRTIDYLKHYTATDFDHNTGSTTGFTTQDPQRNSNNGRHEWTWDVSVPIPAQQSTQLTFSMIADLVPGIYWAVTEMRAEEDTQANGQEATATTGHTAPVEAVRTYTISAVLGGHRVDVTASLDSSGVAVKSWLEQ
jgi:hypothetical protein